MVDIQYVLYNIKWLISYKLYVIDQTSFWSTNGLGPVHQGDSGPRIASWNNHQKHKIPKFQFILNFDWYLKK